MSFVGAQNTVVRYHPVFILGKEPNQSDDEHLLLAVR